jgi:hypothetical protein
MASSTNMITNTITNVTKSNVILENPADWHEWMIVINHKAESGEAKQLIDPDLTTKSMLLRKPDRPKPSDTREGVTTTVALTAAEREEFRFQNEDGRVKRWDKCLCGEVHTFRECPYLIEERRSADWYPNPDTKKEIDHELANIPKLKAAVEKAQKEMKEKPPDKPQKRIGGSLTLLSF